MLDALCRSHGVSFFAAPCKANLAGIGAARPEFGAFDFDRFLAALRPAPSIEARHTVGMVDAITAADLTERVNDGLPETLEEVIAAWGHRYFKLKVGGQIEADLARLEAIAAVLDRLADPYFVSLDGNEQYSDAQGVAELVAGMRARPALARLWESILFIEQPIARKLALDTDLRRANLGKPVIIDESDGELGTFAQARERGYLGVSSKTCKGLYKSLLNAARCAQWNAQAGTARYFMSAEDLTTQAGLSVQQDLALVSLLGITHVERNGHYYVNGMAAQSAAEQEAFLAAHPDLYERSHGAVRLRISRWPDRARVAPMQRIRQRRNARFRGDEGDVIPGLATPTAWCGASSKKHPIDEPGDDRSATDCEPGIDTHRPGRAKIADIALGKEMVAVRAPYLRRHVGPAGAAMSVETATLAQPPAGFERTLGLARQQRAPTVTSPRSLSCDIDANSAARDRARW